MATNLHFITEASIDKRQVGNYNLTVSSNITADPGFNEDLSGNTIYVIDTHFTFLGQKHTLQGQHGLDFYRHLLNKFADCQEMLKVVFYSPLPADFLIDKKPENYVLKFLPFVQQTEDNNFKNNLINLINEYDNKGWPRFNNASENLLGGWSLYTKDISNSNNGKICSNIEITIIDDQIEEWEQCYKTIFNNADGLNLLKYDKLKGKTGEFEIKKIGDNAEKLIKKSKMILADFYLEERHLSHKWMDIEELKDKSGYKLLDYINNESKRNNTYPYYVHSSSNKIQYFKTLSREGVDNWLVKDTRFAVDAEYKKYAFEIFKKEIEVATIGENAKLIERLALIKSKIDNIIKAQSFPYWWQNNNDRPVLISLLEYCYSALRENLLKEILAGRESGADFNSFIYNSIVSELGKILEIKNVLSQIPQGNVPNMLYQFLKQFRNESSHHNDANDIELEDTILYFEIWMEILVLTGSTRDIFKKSGTKYVYMYQEMKTKDKTTSLINRKLFCLLQLANSNSYSKVKSVNYELKKRCENLLRIALKDIDKFKEELWEHEVKDDDDPLYISLGGTGEISRNSKGYCLDIDNDGYLKLFDR